MGMDQRFDVNSEPREVAIIKSRFCSTGNWTLANFYLWSIATTSMGKFPLSGKSSIPSNPTKQTRLLWSLALLNKLSVRWRYGCVCRSGERCCQHDCSAGAESQVSGWNHALGPAEHSDHGSHSVCTRHLPAGSLRQGTHTFILICIVQSLCSSFC